jgi:hypothetical protein
VNGVRRRKICISASIGKREFTGEIRIYEAESWRTEWDMYSIIVSTRGTTKINHAHTSVSTRRHHPAHQLVVWKWRTSYALSAYPLCSMTSNTLGYLQNQHHLTLPHSQDCSMTGKLHNVRRLCLGSLNVAFISDTGKLGMGVASGDARRLFDLPEHHTKVKGPQLLPIYFLVVMF